MDYQQEGRDLRTNLEVYIKLFSARSSRVNDIFTIVVSIKTCLVVMLSYRNYFALAFLQGFFQMTLV